MFLVSAIAVFILTFLLGSIPWGLIISRVFYHTDIRQHGSGNIGTTNALRSMGKVGGTAVFLLDFGKGLLSGLVALVALSFMTFSTAVGDDGLTPQWHAEHMMLAVATMGCTLGHIYSPWLGFKGGKGIAVAIGCLFVSFGPVGALAELFIFAALVFATRYVSVGSIASACACPVIACVLYWGDWTVVLCFSIVACVVVWAHRSNVQRLREGTEHRIGAKKERA